MPKTFRIAYTFTLPNGDLEIFDLAFDARKTELIMELPKKALFWTRLEYEKCVHCPLQPNKEPHCPVALNLVPAITKFDHLMSFDKISVSVVSSERRVELQTTAQEGLSSLMGLLIAGSRCPYTHFFKPMARFHLPFASKDETLWRAAATYLMGRYFTTNGMGQADVSLDGLVKIYNDIARLNDAMVQRLRAASSKDSVVNALVHLDVFAKFLMPPVEDSLAHIKSIFAPFLNSLESVPIQK